MPLTGTWADTNGYLGAPVTAATGLTTIAARQYDPVTGRFLSPDPLLEPGNPGEGSEIWIRNTQFLDQAVASGSDIVPTANPADPVNEGSFFLRELDYLYGDGN